MRYIYEGEIYDYLTDAIESAFSEDDYEEYLNDNEEIVRIGAYLTYGQGAVLRAVDPVAFRCAYLEHIDFIADDDRDAAMEEFGIEEYDDAYNEDEDGIDLEAVTA